MTQRVVSMWDRITRDSAPVMQNAQDVVVWSGCEYHDKFLAWLRAQADEPINPKSSHADLMVANARANTMKEVRSYLIALEERAHQALERENG